MPSHPQLWKLLFITGSACWLCLEGCWSCCRAAGALDVSLPRAPPPLPAEPAEFPLGQEALYDVEGLRAVVEESWLEESFWAHQESWIEGYVHRERQPASLRPPPRQAAAKAAKAKKVSSEGGKQQVQSAQAKAPPPRRASRAAGLLLRGLLVLLAAGGLFRLYAYAKEEDDVRELSEEEEAKKAELLRAQAQLQFAAESLSAAVGTRDAALVMGTLQQHLELSEELLHKIGDPSVSARLAEQYASLMGGAIEAANRLQGAARDAANKLSRNIRAPPASSRWPKHVGGDTLEGFEGVQASAITLRSMQTCCELLWKHAEVPARQVVERRSLVRLGDSFLLRAASVDIGRLSDLVDLRDNMDNVSNLLTSSTLHAIRSALLLSRRQLRTPLHTEVQMLTVLHRKMGERASEAPFPSAANALEEETFLLEATEIAEQYAAALERIEVSDSLAAMQQANQQAVVLEEQLKELVGCLWRWWQEAPEFEQVVVESEAALAGLVGARSAEAVREATETEEKVKRLLESLEQRLVAASSNPHPYAHPDLVKKLLTETQNLKNAAMGRAAQSSQQHSSSSGSPSNTSAGGRRVLALSEAARASLERAFFAHALNTAVQMVDLSAAVLDQLVRDALRSFQVKARAVHCVFNAPVRGSKALQDAHNAFTAASAAARKADTIEGLALATARMRVAALELESLMYESDRQAYCDQEGEQEQTTD
ncbi:hypothetical protein Emed_001852 [Eimeria media]